MSSEQRAKERMTEIKTAMLLHQPFFASLLLDQMKISCGKFPHIFGNNTPTAATDGRHIYVDEDFIIKLSLPEAVFLMCHEIGHAMWHHMPRAKRYQDQGFNGQPFEPRKWNFAGDYVINDMLIKAKVGKMPAGGLHNAKYDHVDWTADDVYKDLPNDPSKNSNGQQPLDTHIPAADDGVSEAEWARAVQSAADRAKAQGKMPEALRRLVDELLNPKVPWQDILRTTLLKVASRDAHTWTKPHKRRLITQGVVLPSYTGFGAGTIVVAVDTSGSIGEKELRVFLTELQSILDMAKPEAVWLVPCDAEVHKVTELLPGDDLARLQPPVEGGGGTSFVPVFEWVAEHGIDAAALVYLTDMYGTFPDEPPPYKTIWCATSDVAAPFGERVQIDLGDYDEGE